MEAGFAERLTEIEATIDLDTVGTLRLIDVFVDGQVKSDSTHSGHIEIELAGETVLTLEAASVDVHPELMTGEFSGVSAAGVTVTGSFRCGG